MMNLNRSNGSSNSMPMTQHHQPPPPPPPPHHHNPSGIPTMGTPFVMPHNATPLNVNNLMGNSMGNNTCIHARNSISHGVPHGLGAPNHIDPSSDQVFSGSLTEDNSGPYFMNRDGCMETTASAEAVMAAAQGATGLPPAPPPPLLGAAAAAVGASGNTNVINQQGIKSLVHDVQLKRQKEIRDMMKKKREKAVLVDRISRWLFPTSFILLNIVYWALFGDHDLW